MKKKEITKKLEQPENQSVKHIKNNKKTVNLKIILIRSQLQQILV